MSKSLNSPISYQENLFVSHGKVIDFYYDNDLPLLQVDIDKNASQIGIAIENFPKSSRQMPTIWSRKLPSKMLRHDLAHALAINAVFDFAQGRSTYHEYLMNHEKRKFEAI